MRKCDIMRFWSSVLILTAAAVCSGLYLGGFGLATLFGVVGFPSAIYLYDKLQRESVIFRRFPLQGRLAYWLQLARRKYLSKYMKSDSWLDV